MHVVVMAPMQVELSPVVRELGLRRDGGPRASHRGELSGVQITAALAGVGPAAATDATRWALDTLQPDHLIVSGIAGGIAADLAIGDLVIPVDTVAADSGRVARPVVVGDDLPRGRIVTTATLLAMDELADFAEAGAIAVDMETAAIGALCEDAGVPWSAYRGISDLVSEGLVDDSTLSLVKTDGTADVAGIARLVLTRPWTLPRMARLGRDTQQATRAAAKAAARAVVALGRA